MGNEIPLDNIAPLSEGQIFIDSVRQYRCDCQLGQFKIGASTLRGPKMEIEIIAAKMYTGEFFGYEMQDWICLLFIDHPDGVLSQTLLKTESLSNFQELYRQYRVKGESLLGKKIRCTFSKRSSRTTNGNYYAVEFEVVDNGKYAQAIAEFRELHYSPQLFRQLGSELDTETPALPASAALTTSTATPALLPEKVIESSEETVPVDAATAARTVNRKKAPQAQSMVH